VLKGRQFLDRDSQHNGQPLDLQRLLPQLDPEVGWTPLLHGPLDPVDQVATRVRAGAGARAIIQNN
jgi:pectate lyase